MQREKFKLDIKYLSDSIGVYLSYLPEESLKNTTLLKNELVKLQKASAEEVKRLSEQLVSDRKAMQKELALQEKNLKSQNDAERKLLLEKMAKDSAAAQARLDILKNELAAANQTLQVLNKKMDTPTPATVPAPAADKSPAPPAETAGKAAGIPGEAGK